MRTATDHHPRNIQHARDTHLRAQSAYDKNRWLAETGRDNGESHAVWHDANTACHLVMKWLSQPGRPYHCPLQQARERRQASEQWQLDPVKFLADVVKGIRSSL
ncbi:hypothetical protein SeMB42_g04111 [Synchytrium endobioticum]|uniref:Uncharacterized protein n=1 Tax=Synchytrium endobioticum TaxID=286115 RepID=A0A507D1A4_9FUNG|nr:hypothetical protein SeMB42_g04111 [Synchytrium endobioticum]